MVEDTETYEGIECPGDGETVLLESIGADATRFEDCTLPELLAIVEKIRKWKDVFDP